MLGMLKITSHMKITLRNRVLVTQFMFTIDSVLHLKYRRDSTFLNNFY